MLAWLLLLLFRLSLLTAATVRCRPFKLATVVAAEEGRDAEDATVLFERARRSQDTPWLVAWLL